MSERVLFEYRAGEEGAGGSGLKIKVGRGAIISCQACVEGGPGATVKARVDVPRGRRWARRAWKKARRRVGETLDFFEGVYQDLYGADEGSTEESQ